jgi:CheY-like chemotaxis protein
MRPTAATAPAALELLNRHAGRRVLLVEDNPANRQVGLALLQAVGLAVDMAEDGAQAVERAQAGRYALVLMDVQMPVMDGYTATRHLRDRGYTAPVLALTANAMKGFEREIEAAGFTSYLTKPVNIDALLQTLSEHLTGCQVALEDAPQLQPQALPERVIQTAPSPRPSTRQADGAHAGALTRADGRAGAAPAPAGTAAPAGPPIRSRLESHPRLGRVVRTFARTLPIKLAQMHEALEDRRFVELGELAHWLKGAGGTVGFDSSLSRPVALNSTRATTTFKA